MTDKEYYADKEYLTNTMLGWITISPSYYTKQVSLMGLEKEEDKRFSFGSAVHCRILEKAEFTKRFYVQATDSPSNAIQKKFCSLLVSHKKVTDKALETAYKLSYSVKNIKDEAILAKAKALYEEYKSYIKQEQTAGDKTALTSNEYDRILAIEKNVLSNKRAMDLLKKIKFTEAKNESVIKYTFHDIKFKSKLDRYIIDTENKVIIVVDFKTHTTQREDVNFTDSFVKTIDNYDYDRQLYLYSAALTSYFKKHYPKENIEDYELQQKIIAARSNFDNCIKVYDIGESFLISGESKFEQALNCYNFYETNGYDKDYSVNELGEELLIKT